jgi:GAF domain-containing protein
MPFQPQPDLIKALQGIAEDLFDATKPGRVTIRVETTNDPDFPVLGEACAPGVSSLTGGMSLLGYKPVDIHTASTHVFLREKRQMIIQQDVRVDPPQIPELVDYFGFLSQMLTPIEWKERFVGVVSVHGTEPRFWTDSDVTAIKRATDQTERELEQAIWFDIAR